MKYPYPTFISSSILAQGIFRKNRSDNWNINNWFSFSIAEYIFAVNLEKRQKRKSTI